MDSKLVFKDRFFLSWNLKLPVDVSRKTVIFQTSTDQEKLSKLEAVSGFA